MKINEELLYDHETDSVIHKKTHDYNPEIHMAKVLRETIGEEQRGADNKLVGTIPMSLIGEWLKEAGVDWSDSYAVEETVKRKILSGDFDKFRIWKGNY